MSEVNWGGTQLWVDGRPLPNSGVWWYFSDSAIDHQFYQSSTTNAPLLYSTADEGQGMTLDELLGAIDEELGS